MDLCCLRTFRIPEKPGLNVLWYTDAETEHGCSGVHDLWIRGLLTMLFHVLKSRDVFMVEVCMLNCDM